MNLLLPPKNKHGLAPYAYWENFLSNEDIKTILSLREWHMSKQAEIGPETTLASGVVDKNIRNSRISWMGYNEETVNIWSKILNAVNLVNHQYFHYDLSGCHEPAQLTLYDSNNQEHYNWHTDSSLTDNNVPRKLSMSLLLSDCSEFTGGELELLVNSDQPVQLNQVRGRAWFFPSHTIHRVTPVTSGIRRSLVLWIGGPNFK